MHRFFNDSVEIAREVVPEHAYAGLVRDADDIR